jgi:hypothetical protein
MPHGFNVNIKGIDNINSHMHDNSDVNVMNLLSINQRINRIHDRRNYHRPISLSGTINDLCFPALKFIFGYHYICTTHLSLRAALTISPLDFAL